MGRAPREVSERCGGEGATKHTRRAPGGCERAVRRVGRDRAVRRVGRDRAVGRGQYYRSAEELEGSC